MSVEIAWKQNNLVTDFHLLKLLQVDFGLGLQTFVCDFSRQNICSVYEPNLVFIFGSPSWSGMQCDVSQKALVQIPQMSDCFVTKIFPFL